MRGEQYLDPGVNKRSIHKVAMGMALLTAMLSGARANAQGGATGAIGGAVVDTSGGAISGAEVQIINTSTESVVRKLPTNADGEFFAPLLPPGTYSAVVNKSGFAEAKVAGIA